MIDRFPTPDRPIHRRPIELEQLAEVADRIAAGRLHLEQIALLGYHAILLYPLKRTGPVIPAHPGDDQERVQAEREFPEDALCPAWSLAMLLRARCP